MLSRFKKKNVTTENLEEALDNVLVVRETHDLDKGHMEGAYVSHEMDLPYGLVDDGPTKNNPNEASVFGPDKNMGNETLLCVGGSYALCQGSHIPTMTSEELPIT